jgi:hypothetical protein
MVAILLWTVASQCAVTFRGQSHAGKGHSGRGRSCTPLVFYLTTASASQAGSLLHDTDTDTHSEELQAER